MVESARSGRNPEGAPAVSPGVTVKPASRAAAAAILLALPILAAGGCGLARQLPEGAAYIPADSAFVLAMNLPELSSTDLYKELREKGGAVGLNRFNFMQFATAAGIDPSKDVRWLTFLGRGSGDEGMAVDQLSALVSGTFDGKKVHDFLKDSGLPYETHAGLEIFQVVIVGDRCRLCVAVLDDTTAAFGDGETLEAMGDARQGEAGSLLSDETARRLLQRIDTRGAIWGIARGKRLAGSLAGFLHSMADRGGALAAFSSIEDMAFFVSTGETILVAVDAVASDDKSALMVADILEGAGAMGKLALKQSGAKALSLLEPFKVQVDGRVVRASTNFPQSALVDLAHSAMADMFRGLPVAPGFPAMPGAAPGGTTGSGEGQPGSDAGAQDSNTHSP